MPSAADARRARVSAAINRAFGEEFSFVARKHAADVNLPRVPDLSRATFTVFGVWSGPSHIKTLPARGHAADHAQEAIASAPSLKLDVAALQWRPSEGDLCTRVETVETFVVGRVVPDGFGRLKIWLTAKQR